MFTKSRKPRKQRKARYEAPLHKRQKLINAHLSKEARDKLGTKKRSIPIRSGDRVKIMRGKFKGHVGKVSKVNLRKLKVYVEGAVIKKARGQEVLVPIQPSNIMIIDPVVSDKRRARMLERNPLKSKAG